MKEGERRTKKGEHKVRTLHNPNEHGPNIPVGVNLVFTLFPPRLPCSHYACPASDVHAGGQSLGRRPGFQSGLPSIRAAFNPGFLEMQTPTSKPTLVLMAGLPGVGKTTLALALGRKLGWPVLDKDTVKTTLLAMAVPDALASPASYTVPFALCRDLVVQQQLSVIFDSPAAYPSNIEDARQIAEASGGTLKVIYCQAGSRLRNQRLAQRTRRVSQMESDPTTDAEGRMRFAHLPPERLDLLMERPLSALTADALAYIRL